MFKKTFKTKLSEVNNRLNKLDRTVIENKTGHDNLLKILDSKSDMHNNAIKKIQDVLREMEIQHNDHWDKQRKLGERDDELERRIIDLKIKKADDSDLKKLCKRFEMFSSIENVKTLETVALPKMLGFTNQVVDLEEKLDEMHEILRKYDEDISTKCDKTALILMRESLERQFIYRDDYEQMEKTAKKISFSYNNIQQNLKKWFEELTQKQEGLIAEMMKE